MSAVPRASATVASMRMFAGVALVSASGACGGGSPTEAKATTDGSTLVGDATAAPGLDAAPDAATDATNSEVSDGATTTPGDAAPSDAAPTTRDPFAQPFASTSIWNMPIGSGAVYVPASIKPATGTSLEADDDVIVLTPTAPSTDIYINTADWDPTKSRCAVEGALLFAAPMPSDFVVPDPMQQTPNSGLAVLLDDSRTIKQTQPFARCTAGQSGTSHYDFADEDLYGPGIGGAHGGSGLSAIGGTLRLGELRPNGSPPHHVLKFELYAADNYYNDGQQADCSRWPASGCDGYFDTSGNALKYGGTNPALRPGSLLALSTSVAIPSLGLKTTPAQLIAWTLQNYGAYLVDDTAWSAYAVCVENGAAGSFETQFQSDWGFSIDTAGTTGDFAQDMQKLVSALSVVNNNAVSSVGGGGTPLQPLAPPLPLPLGDP
jgi:hypothetical protein